MSGHSLWPHGPLTTKLLCLWGFSRQECWGGFHSLLQGIFPILKPRSPGLQADSLPMSHQRSPRILEWVVYPFSRGSSWPGVKPGLLLAELTGKPRGSLPQHSKGHIWQVKLKVKSLGHVRPFVTPRTVAHQAPPSTGFSRQEYRSGFPSSGDLPDPGIEPRSPTLQADALTSEPPGKPMTSPQVISFLMVKSWKHLL